MHTHRFQIVSKRLPRPIWAAGWSVQLCKAVAWCSSRRPNEKRRRRNCLANQVGTRLTYCPALFMFILTWWLAFRLASSIIVHNAWAHTHTNTRSHTHNQAICEVCGGNNGQTILVLRAFRCEFKKLTGRLSGIFAPFTMGYRSILILAGPMTLAWGHACPTARILSNWLRFNPGV